MRQRKAPSIPEATATPPTERHAVTASLQQIREHTLRQVQQQRLNINNTITELNALSNEITATIAFLRAQQHDR